MEMVVLRQEETNCGRVSDVIPSKLSYSVASGLKWKSFENRISNRCFTSQSAVAYNLPLYYEILELGIVKPSLKILAQEKNRDRLWMLFAKLRGSFRERLQQASFCPPTDGEHLWLWSVDSDLIPFLTMNSTNVPSSSNCSEGKTTCNDVIHDGSVFTMAWQSVHVQMHNSSQRKHQQCHTVGHRMRKRRQHARAAVIRVICNDDKKSAYFHHLSQHAVITMWSFTLRFWKQYFQQIFHFSVILSAQDKERKPCYCGPDTKD